MLEVLFGGKNIKQVLLFLFVNGKCYGTQLHKALKTPLTPIQKALSRLERSGVVISFNEGKTRLYQFNPAWPLLLELEAFLKKAYTLLSAHEKKYYFFTQLDNRNSKRKTTEDEKILLTFWSRLVAVKALTFHATTKSKEEGGWKRKGIGEVEVIKEHDSILIFSEKGTWKGVDGNAIDFSNLFRWTLDRSGSFISLEHLRRGINHPVFLFHLAPSGNSSLTSINSHLCEGDAYFGQIHCDKHNLRLNWRAIGPKKNEEMDYYYL